MSNNKSSNNARHLNPMALVGLALGIACLNAPGEANPAAGAPASEPNLRLFHNDAEQAHPAYPDRVDRKELENAIDACARFLVRMCNSEGKFIYRVNLDTGVRVRERYNIVRHAGAIYALAEYYQWRQDPEVLDTIRRAMLFMRQTVLGPVPGQADMTAIWSPPELEGRKNKPLQAKLGGTALGLAAAISANQIDANCMPLADLQQMGRFICFMQKPDGAFYPAFIPGEIGRDDSWVSLYYPGESVLALAMLYEQDPSTHWLNAALRGLGHLARSREGAADVEPDHWALIATSLLLTHYESTDKSVPQETLERHALQIIANIMRQRPAYPDTSPLNGALQPDGRTTPTATRLEGMLAIFDLVKRSPFAEPGQVAAAIRGGIAFLLRSQIRAGEYQGGIPRAIRREPGADPTYNERAGEIRIDYVQHAMSAMIKYARSPLAQ